MATRRYSGRDLVGAGMKTALLDPEEVTKGSNFTVYTKRWVVLIIFVLSGVANALVLLSWSPISDIASDYWGNIGATAVNLLAVSFQIMYIPGTALSAKTMKVTNLRTTMILGGLLTTVGCLIRWVGGFGRDNGNFTPVFSYVCVLLGTIVVATAQPFYLNMPAKIAAAWFAVQERDVATTLCSLANPLGSALGSILPAMIVSGSGHDVKGVSILLLVQLIVAIAGLTFTYFFFESTPPTPPSNSTLMMTSNKEENDEQTSNVWTEVKELLRKPEYVKLLIGFAIALGNLNALAALLNQLPGDYSNGKAGNLGAVLIMCGFLGAFLTGFILDSSKAYRTILKTSYFGAVLAWIFFASNCRGNNFALLLTSSAILGFILLPIIPSTIVNSVECAYPSSEDIAVGLLYVCANTLAIPMTFIGQILLTADSFGPAPLFPYGVWVIATMVLGAIPVLMSKGQYLRLEQDEFTGEAP